ncbi:hypothetical protein QZH41_018872 [Actinostola sp. cb2023]|nr:hypothetical protein QZH41_018872 [Actinostola sp. cb2023]
MSNATNTTTVIPPTTAAPVITRNNSAETFVVALIINGIIAIVVLLIFSLLRAKHKHIYAPRLLLVDKTYPLGSFSERCFGWILPALRATNDDIFNYSGMDALVLIRFLRLCLVMSLIILPYGIVVLLPLHVHGGLDLEQLDQLTMSNVKAGSPKVWAHLIAVWVYTVVLCYLLYREWKIYIEYRQRYLAKGLKHHYAVLVRDLPAKLQDNESLKTYLEQLFPGQVDDVAVIENLDDWQEMVNQHDQFVWKLEKAKFLHEKKGERPMHKTKLCGGEKVDSIAFYEAELKKCRDNLEEEKGKDHKALPAAFIIFKSLKTASIAMQCQWDSIPISIGVKPAPEVNNVIWGNLGIGFCSRKIRSAIVAVFVFLLVVFWMIPVAFVSSLIQLESLGKRVPFLAKVNELPIFVTGFLGGFLGGLALLIFFIILPLILRLVSKLQGLVSLSEVQRSTLGKLFIFKILNMFLLLAVAGSVMNKLDEMIKKPMELPTFLAQTLPSQSTFFITLILLMSFGAFPMELLRIGPLIVVAIKRKFCNLTPREDKAAWRPPPIAYDVQYANHLYALIVGLCYSIMAPLMTPFTFTYFLLAYVVWSNQVLCVYIPIFDSGGLLWPKVFNRIIAGLLVFQALMIGIFGLKKIAAVSILVLPLPVITLLFFAFVQFYLLPLSENLTQVKVNSEEEPQFPQEITQGYIRNFKLPEELALSKEALESEEHTNEAAQLISNPSHPTQKKDDEEIDTHV